MDVTLTARQVLLEKTRQVTDAGGEPKCRGVTDADLQFEAPLGKFTQQASGSGVIGVRQGKLVGLPVIGLFHRLINHELNVVTDQPSSQWSATVRNECNENAGFPCPFRQNVAPYRVTGYERLAGLALTSDCASS